jgi:putative ABC transport system permease protein
MTVLVHTSADLPTAASFIKATVKELDPQQSIGFIEAVNSLIDESVAPRRLNLFLMFGFALLAVLLTAAGLYGVVSYLVVQRLKRSECASRSGLHDGRFCA